ncbi:hypothetical protein D3C87_1916540 [compost metagenome]
MMARRTEASRTLNEFSVMILPMLEIVEVRTVPPTIQGTAAVPPVRELAINAYGVRPLMMLLKATATSPEPI